MKNTLIDVSIKTMVGLLPGIITLNNKSILNEFNNIYDSDKNKLILPYIDTTNSSLNDRIISSNAEFKTLNVDVLNIGNISSKNNIVSNVNHNLLSNRYSMTDSSVPDNLKQYIHDANSIGVIVNNNVKSLLDTITDIYSKLNNISGYALNNNATNISDINNINSIYGINNSLAEPLSFTFDNNLLFASAVLLKRMNLPLYLYNDVKSGYLYTYYDFNNVLYISDENTASIKGLLGSVVHLKFKDTKSKAYYRIILSRKNNKFLRIAKDELIRVSLICISNSEEFGTEWDVNDYSVRHADDIIIEKKN